MSANLCERRRLFKPRRSPVLHTVIDRKKQWEPIQRRPLPPVTDDEEMKVVARSVMWMAVVAVIPLILFHIVNDFHPEIFLNPITPN